MKAARDGGEDFYDPERKDNILGRKKTRLEMWEEHFKDPIVTLDSAWRIRIKADYWLEDCCGIGLQWLVAERAQARCQRCGTNLCEKRLALLGSLGQCAFAHSIHALEVPKKYGPHDELFFSMVLSELVEFGPCFSAETVQACALIGLYMNSYPDLGDFLECGCPKSTIGAKR